MISGGGGLYFEDKNLCDMLEIGAERKEKPQQVVCYRARDESQGLDL